MGCDIHAFYEAKINGVWHMYKNASRERDYTQFALLADVRNYNNITPISNPRGLPVDVSVIVKAISEDYGSDGHSHSFLLNRELDVFEERYQKEIETNKRYFTFVYKDGMTSEFRLLPEIFEDVRMVFFFDN